MNNLFDTEPIASTAPMTAYLTFRCRVVGEPQAQGSMKAFTPKGGRFAVVTSTNAAKLKPWRNIMTCAFIETTDAAGIERPMFTEAVEVSATIILPRLKSMAKTSRAAYRWPTSKGDLDKHQRSVGDALAAAQIVQDDSLICGWNALKRYAEIGESAGVIVTVKPIGARDMEAA